MRQYLTFLKKLSGLALIGGLILAAGGSVAAQSISVGYMTNDPELEYGMAVGASDESINGRPVVERARSSRAGQILGIAVAEKDGLITITSGTAQVFVATQGEVDAYVSNYAGNIQADEELILSPITGVLMAAPEGVVGIATAKTDFDPSTGKNVEVQIEGVSQTKQVGKIRVSVHIDAARTTSSFDSFRSRIGKMLGRENISGLRIIAALLIFIGMLIVEGSLVYGAVSGAVTSIGRNPLSRGSIHQALRRSLVIALAILAVAAGTIFLILWL